MRTFFDGRRIPCRRTARRPNFVRLSAALAAVLAAGTLSLSAQQKDAATPPVKAQTEATYGDIKLKAERWTRIEDRITGDGNVEVRYKNIILFADHIDIDSKTKDVVAIGQVSLHIAPQGRAAQSGAAGASGPGSAPQESPSDTAVTEVISGERLDFNMDSGRGKMENAFGLIQPTYVLEAGTLERESDIYHMTGMSFTECTQPTPRWQFSCSRANLKKDDYIEMWGVVFTIKGLPLFYWPYMKYPLNRERATGFLMPKYGYSAIKGLFYMQNFYWAIARNMDATLEADLYSKKGQGVGLDYRYLFNGGTGGTLNVFYFRFKPGSTTAAGEAEPPEAAIIRWKHNQPLPGGFTLTADVDYQSSYNFLREFDNNFQTALVSNRSSQVFLTKSWAMFSLSIRASQFETNFPGASGLAGNSIVTRYLPQVSFNSYKIKMIGPVYFSFSSGFNRWLYGWQSDYDAGTELRLQSTNFTPVLTVPWSALPWLSINAALTGNFKYFWQTYETGATGTRQIVDKPLFVFNYGASVDVIGPSFYKIYEIGDSRIKHLIEPSVGYRYDSPVADRNRIVTAAGYFNYHQLTYGLTNHLYIKAKDAGPEVAQREVLTFGLAETFYLAPEQGPLSYYRVNGLPPKFSEISSYLRFFPGGKINVDVSASFNPYYKTVSSLRLGAGMGRPTDDFFLNVSWFKSINAWLKGAAETANLPLEYSSIWDRHQISIYGGLKAPALDLEIKGEADFNIMQKKLLYAAGDVLYHYQCLDFKAEMRIFYFRDMPEIQFNFSVGVGNISRSGSVLGSPRF